MIGKYIVQAFCKKMPYKQSYLFMILLGMSVIAFNIWLWSTATSKQTPDEIIISSGVISLRNNEKGNLKYILLWTISSFFYGFNRLGNGQNFFIQFNCTYVNCYLTTNKTLLSDVSNFDAIVFDHNISDTKVNLPKKRSSHQKYIFSSLESADNYPNCDPKFEGFFNWTATYKTNSDIAFTYLRIRNKEGQIIGPKKNVDWMKESSDIDENMTSTLQNKSKAAVMFVSDCKAKNNGMAVLVQLQKALNKFNLTVDVYGECGTLQCPVSNHSACMEMVKRDYYFYLVFENGFDEDYVTEKLLDALEADAIPIVFGGADYSRFLPCGSYLNGRLFTAKGLADVMHLLMVHPTLYQKYFTWKKHYTYYDPYRENVCSLCAALNNKTMMKTSVYDNFRKWWNPTHREACSDAKQTFIQKLLALFHLT